jgi:hypothetical protein
MKLNRLRGGRKVFSLAAIAVITLAFTTAPTGRSASAAEAAEQVIFSGTGLTNDGQLEIGYWIWCTPEGNSPSTRVLAEDRSVLTARDLLPELPVCRREPGWDLCDARLCE